MRIRLQPDRESDVQPQASVSVLTIVVEFVPPRVGASEHRRDTCPCAGLFAAGQAQMRTVNPA